MLGSEALWEETLQRLRDKIEQPLFELRLLAHHYLDGEPVRAWLHALIEELQADPLEALDIARLQRVAEGLDPEEPADGLVLRALRELACFVYLAKELRDASHRRPVSRRP